MQTSMAAQRMGADPDDRIKVYRDQIQKLGEVRKSYNEAAMASGNWHVQTVKNVSASEAFTDRVRKQKLGISELTRAYAQFRKTGGGALGEAIKEQTALRNATATQMTSSLFGKNMTDLHLPKNLGPELDNARVKLGMISQAIGAASTQMVNWGKNTQWAGRQITVGLTMPLGMAAVGAAALALKVDQELTRIAKVYDTTNTGAIGTERELADVRRQGLETATRMAHEYGAAMTDVLQVQADLAATGLRGAELQQATSEVTRIATLGELDFQMATEATISLQNAFSHQIQTTDDLANSFNYLNAVENATSLQLSDVVEAIPRVASAFAGLGGTVQDMTVQLVAMREAGVDPTEAANSLKSATASLLDPTQEAIDLFKDSFNIDLPQVVDDAEGNLLQITQALAGMTSGFEPQKIQQAISVLFGKYQFNRQSALWKNLGDAMNGVQNQTWQAMQLGSQTTEEMALAADAEIDRLQNSISGKFKSAVEGFKAELIPLGETVLQFLTPIIQGVTNLVGWFNNLPGAAKSFFLIIAAAGAIVGPLLMILGIFANLAGNVVKFGATLANLRVRFRAMNAEEAAAEIMARRASSAFQTEESAVAQLTLQIKALSEAMEQNAIASGLMMDANGKIGDRNIVAPRHGEAYYGPGSKDAQGNRLDAMPVKPEDMDRYNAMRETSEEIADNTETSKKSWSEMAQGASNFAGIILPTMAAFMTDMEGVTGLLLDVGLIGAGLVQTGMLDKPIDKVKESVTGIFADFSSGKIQEGIAAGFTKMTDKAKAATRHLKDQGMVSTAKKTGTALATAGKAIGGMASGALKIFGPIGILAGGLIILKMIADSNTKLYRQQEAINKSAQGWADILGFTYSMGAVAGNEANQTTFQALQDEVDALKEAMPDLAARLSEAGSAGDNFAEAIRLSRIEALKVVTSGGTVAQAQQAFRVALQTAGMGAGRVEELAVEFGEIDLANPDNVRQMLIDELRATIGTIPIAVDLQAEGAGWGGGMLNDRAERAAREAGATFAQAFRAEADVNNQALLFQGMEEQFNNTFSNNWEDWISKQDEDVQAYMEQMGIHSIEAFIRAQQNAQRDGLFSNDSLYFARESGVDPANLPPEFEAYQEGLTALYQGMVDVGALTQDEMDRMIDDTTGAVQGLNTAQGLLDIPEPIRLWSLDEAAQEYETSIREIEASHGRAATEGEKLAALNYSRAQMGLEAATDSAQGFGAAAVTTAGQIDQLAAATASIEITPEMSLNALKSSMEGVMSDIYAEADRRLQASQDRQMEGIRAGGERRQKRLEDESKRMDKEYDQREKDLERHQKNENKIFEQSWDDREKREEDYWEWRESELDNAIDRENDNADARIDHINAIIDAEQKADEERQRIFDREKTRIQRMAQLHNTNIDFNAALNTGDLDEAAKLYTTNQATTQQWGMEDQNEDNKTAMQKRHEELEATIDAIERERDARVEALERQKEAVQAEGELRREQLRLTRELETEAFQERQQRATEELQTARQTAQEALDARKEADRQATESATRRAQASYEAERRELAGRLRELQAFTPRNETELREHIARVEAMYGEYGLDLQAQGSGWSGFIGTSLQQNVNSAAVSLQNDVNWQGMGKVISDRIEAGTGVALDDLNFFIRNGHFRGQDQGGGGIFGSMFGGIINMINGRHTGGEIGGPGWSAKDRTGVPRTASLYPSETMALLKRGEFVVNEKATRANLPLLQQINSGAVARHEGGIAAAGNNIMAGWASMYGAMIEAGVSSYVNGETGRGMVMDLLGQARGSESISGGGTFAPAGTGGNFQGPSGGTSQTERMFNTIKRHFPRVKLNDALRPGAADMHGRGKAIDIGLQGVPGGNGNQYMADMNRWIHDNIPNVYELIYTGLGDDRPDLKRGRPLNYGAATNAGHKNHVHWAMESFHKGGQWLPSLNTGGFTLSDGLANLHKGEAVLTKPLTQEFVNNVATGSDSGYNVTIDLRGAMVREDVDIERAVEQAIAKRESRNGRRRVVA